MIKYLAARLGQLLVVLFIVSLLVFFITGVVGDPLQLMVRENASPAERQAAIEYLGLDRPLPVQYAKFLGSAFSGDFGKSYMYHTSALKLIAERFPATLEIVIVAMLMTGCIAIPLGVYAGAYPKKILSRISMTLSVTGISLPTFWLGMVLIFVFGLHFAILPVSGRGEVGKIFGITTSLATADGWKHVLLPAITLALVDMATILRLTRAGMQETMKQDFIRFARAKGVQNRRVLFGHALKNTLIPVVTIFGLQLGNLIAFTTITETIFAWPGMGKLLIDAISATDRPVISAYILFVAVMFVFLNFLVDLLYTLIDPRIEL